MRILKGQRWKYYDTVVESLEDSQEFDFEAGQIMNVRVEIIS